jgi:hypothetical protein
MLCIHEFMGNRVLTRATSALAHGHYFVQQQFVSCVSVGGRRAAPSPSERHKQPPTSSAIRSRRPLHIITQAKLGRRSTDQRHGTTSVGDILAVQGLLFSDWRDAGVALPPCSKGIRERAESLTIVHCMRWKLAGAAPRGRSKVWHLRTYFQDLTQNVPSSCTM